MLLSSSLCCEAIDIEMMRQNNINILHKKRHIPVGGFLMNKEKKTEEKSTFNIINFNVDIYLTVL